MTTITTFTEAEAAEVLRLKTHVLRDERQRGKISHSKIVLGRIRYTQADLDDYMQRNHVPVASQPVTQ